MDGVGELTRGGRAGLRADCSRCQGLCCVIPGFTRSADFPIDKPPGTPCPNLAPDAGCRVHTTLRDRGFVGCTVYDCFGAGQHLTSRVGEVADRDQLAGPFLVLRDLHELLWYLAEAAELTPAGSPLADRLSQMRARTGDFTASAVADLTAVPLTRVYDEVNALLTEVSDAARREVGRRPFLRGADLAGRDLTGTSLQGANLRGASLIGADLRRADLTLADLTGADLRGADLRGADLRRTLFLTQPQLTSARGDSRTRVPAVLTRPGHWQPRDLPLRPLR